jgi:hypothetical protein
MVIDKDKIFPVRSAFRWTDKKSAVALALAEGYTQQQIAETQGVSDRTIRHWLAETEFRTEVDRLTLMIGIASRAERLRIAKRIVRDKMAQDVESRTEKDLLDWLKFAQSETDGIKLELATAFAEAATSMAGGGQEGVSEYLAIESGDGIELEDLGAPGRPTA